MPSFFRALRKSKKTADTPDGPLQGETPVVTLKLQVLSCSDLKSDADAFVSLNLLGTRKTTPVVKNTGTPQFPSAESTFEFPLYLSLADKEPHTVELIVYDKDLLKKEYLGEAVLGLRDWFPSGRAHSFDDLASSEPILLSLTSTREGKSASGIVTVKLGFEGGREDVIDIYNELLRRSSLIEGSTHAPPTEGMGTVRSGHSIEDDGGLSSDSGEEDGEEADPALLRSVSGQSGTETAFSTTSTTHGTPTSPVKPRSVEHETLGVVSLEILNATQLPKLKNSTHTGFDMDPFVVASFGKKIFRTRVIRHSLNPTWNEKMLFHLHRHQTKYNVNLALLDWDKASKNDDVGSASFDLTELLANAPKTDPNTGLYTSVEATVAHQELKLPLIASKGVSFDKGTTPEINIKLTYTPYDALRQQFWYQYLVQYDTDDTKAISRIEISCMLDSLGSTLSRSTVSSWFERHGKDPRTQEMTFAQAIQCLEEALITPYDQRKPATFDDNLMSSTPTESGRTSPIGGREMMDGPALERLDFSGPAMDNAEKNAGSPSQQRVHERKGSKFSVRKLKSKRKGRVTSASDEDTADEDEGEGETEIEADKYERVINIKTCPMCGRQRLNLKADVDIVTHLAVCANKDISKVNKIAVGEFVTASQAQRKWYTKVLSKVSSGDYKLGANSANILVQDRITGQLMEEKMQVYVRLGIRLLYKGASSRMEGGQARRLLKSLSVKQGLKYDDPASAADIPAFIEFHSLDINEVLDPLDSFKTFNEFFYRKLKPTARPIEAPEDPTRILSPADCRMLAFETINDATRLWIKGREFSVARLLGPTYDASKYEGGALAIFRLAPQDYHRYHCPVDGVVGKTTKIEGEYYTVNPQAIRTALDVYGENVRNIVPIDSPVFGRVMCVCIGAMMVGSIVSLVEEGQKVQKGQDFGYFAFGGSTIVCLFEKGTATWDDDLVNNGKASLETLVRVGSGIGRRTTA